MGDVADLLPASIRGAGYEASAIGRSVYRLSSPEASMILKLFGPDAERTARREVLGAREMTKVIPEWVPRVLETGQCPSGPYVIYEDIGGVTLRRAVDSAWVTQDQALGLLAHVLARVHRRRRAVYGPLDAPLWADAAEFLRSLIAERVGLLVDHGRSDIAAHLVLLGERLALHAPRSDVATLCHGDLHLLNALIMKVAGRWRVSGVVDFESTIYAFPELDIAKSLAVSSCLDEQSQSVILNSYGPSTLSPELVRDLVVFHVIDGWLWAGLIEGRDRHLWDTRLEAVRRADG